jgi:HlyD family secretion protein
MKRAIVCGSALTVVVATFFISSNGGWVGLPPQAEPVAGEGKTIAAPGRVEPVSEEINISSSISGRLQSVPVKEGDPIRVGQVLAVVSNEEYAAREASAKAELCLRQSELRRIVNGAREQQRREALAVVQEAAEVLDHSRRERERSIALFSAGLISQAESEAAESQYRVAQSRYESASQQQSLIDSPAREEDVSQARAAVALAQAQLAEATAIIAKTTIRSPLRGIVLRKIKKAGESVSDAPPEAILTVGDTSSWRVRVDIDEADVATIHAGQEAYLTADAYGNTHIPSRVLSVGHLLGKKNVWTGEPAERADTRILEALLEPAVPFRLPAGLRVTAYIVTAPPASVLKHVP